MNWSKVKTIMIILFLCINIFLVISLITSRYESVTIRSETLEDTVEILQKNSIIVDRSIIPTKMENLPLLQMENSEQDPDLFAKKILGEGYDKKEDGNGYYYSSDGKTLEVHGCEFYYADEMPSEQLEPVNNETVESQVRKILEKMDFNTKYMVLKEVYTLGKDLYSVTFYQQFGGKQIFEDYVSVILGPKGITSMRGYLIVPKEFSGQSLSVRQITGILIDFVRNEDRPKDKVISITSISLGYRVDRSKTDIRETSAFPVWRITTDDGKYYDYEATTGRYILN
ncbi:MAG: hypothetical protein GX066_05085 [Clostridiaceae bacterium]|nr:hypothetical protein [Clostridiaceae bacterium]